MTMAVSRAHAVWEGDLAGGSGRVSVESGAFPELPVSWAARTERPDSKTSPEELISAAHSACYAMAFSNVLATAGHTAEQLTVDAVTHFTPLEGGGMGITRIDLAVSGRVAGVDQAEFERLAAEGEQSCPVSNALRGNVAIGVKATLES
jgi:lipoyl-dependent peroxiredoxin